MSQGSRIHPHLRLKSTSKTELYTYPSGGGGNKEELPPVNRQEHGTKLLRQLQNVAKVGAEHLISHKNADLEGPVGLQIEFESRENIRLAFESLANERSKDGAKNVEILNLVEKDEVTSATIFVPDGKVNHIEKKLNEYLQEKKNRAGKPADNRALIETISNIRLATLEALWTDTPDVFPEDTNDEVWWEVWLPVRGNRDGIISDFKKLAAEAGMKISDGTIEFPERSVLLAKGSKSQLSSSTLLLNSIAELRRAKETADFFDSLTVEEQHDWSEDLLNRTAFDNSSDTRVCILDTGVNSGHPLLTPLISPDDIYSVDPTTDGSDANGHGTEMAGLASWGDLTELLSGSQNHAIPHRLESVKLLNGNGDNEGKNLGDLTGQGISLPIIDNPNVKRVYSMAVSATDTRDRGRPSSWSSSLDSLASDYSNQSENPKLLIVSAGNVLASPQVMKDYPKYNIVEDIHDPAQAWNILSAGAYTLKDNITEEDTDDYSPLAPKEGLSPFSSTSVTWIKNTPIKPELVLEGGNVAVDKLAAVSMPSLGLLTTNHNLQERLFTTSRATSAATALLSKMAAEVMSEYPTLWPETVRALLVHSATWTTKLKEQFATGTTERKRYSNLIRCCGYGVPSLDRAVKSANNSLTMIIEDSLQPFYKLKGKGIKTRDMHVHDIPWPTDILQELGEQEVSMTVTLSYFIEPNPSARGTKGRYNYQSHNLRFDVKRPLESTDQFRARINENARREEEGTSLSGGDPNWLIGSDERHRGSIHKDIWTGTAADLAERGKIAIYPAMGWWKTRQKLDRFDSFARYALVVSIETPESDVDIYSVVKSQIEVETTI